MTFTYLMRICTDSLSKKTVLTTYVKSSQDGQVEGQELEGDDSEDALQTVDSLRQLDGLVGILSHLRVILATKDDGPTLMERVRLTLHSQSVSQFILLYLCENCTRPGVGFKHIKLYYTIIKVKLSVPKQKNRKRNSLNKRKLTEMILFTYKHN